MRSGSRRSATPLLQSLTPERRAPGKGATDKSWEDPGWDARHSRFPVLLSRTRLNARGEAARRRSLSLNLGAV